MSKLSWWELPYVKPVLVATLLWGAGSTWWYVCNTEGLCEAKTAPAVVTPDVVTPVVNKPVEVAPVQAMTPVPAPAKVFFLPDSTEQVAPADLSAIVAYLNAEPTSKAVVTGFVANTVSSYDSGDLSQQRAEAIKQQLVGFGIDESRISLAGKGTDVAAGGEDESVLATGRRVEVSVSK
jgi:OmpA-OmpF porin, OOP family